MVRDLTYSDHEFVNFRLTSRLSDGANSENNEAIRYEINDDVLGLDNDELGMLSWIDASLSVSGSGFSEAQDSNGTAVCTAEIGANLAGSEYLGRQQNIDNVTVVDNDPNFEVDQVTANDEPGLWCLLSAITAGGFKDSAADGERTSGNTVPGEDHQRREYYAETMSGPYVDSTDNLNVGIYLDKDSMGAEVSVQLTGQMSFVIYEYDQRRAEFGPVPGGT